MALTGEDWKAPDDYTQALRGTASCSTASRPGGMSDPRRRVGTVSRYGESGGEKEVAPCGR